MVNYTKGHVLSVKNLSQYLPAHSCGSVSVTGDSNGFCHLCHFLQNTHSALGHPGGSSGSL